MKKNKAPEKKKRRRSSSDSDSESPPKEVPQKKKYQEKKKCTSAMVAQSTLGTFWSAATVLQKKVALRIIRDQFVAAIDSEIKQISSQDEHLDLPQRYSLLGELWTSQQSLQPGLWTSNTEKEDTPRTIMTRRVKEQEKMAQQRIISMIARHLRDEEYKIAMLGLAYAFQCLGVKNVRTCPLSNKLKDHADWSVTDINTDSPSSDVSCLEPKEIGKLVLTCRMRASKRCNFFIWNGREHRFIPQIPLIHSDHSSPCLQLEEPLRSSMVSVYGAQSFIRSHPELLLKDLWDMLFPYLLELDDPRPIAVKTAFQYFADDDRVVLFSNLTVADQWRELPQDKKKVYEERERQDRLRYRHERKAWWARNTERLHNNSESENDSDTDIEGF
jgi:hypothetical protein